jgi:hypothetical protein
MEGVPHDTHSEISSPQALRDDLQRTAIWSRLTKPMNFKLLALT